MLPLKDKLNTILLDFHHQVRVMLHGDNDGYFKAFTGKTKSYNAVPVEVMSSYWHFVDILWIYLLVFFIYLG